jgi:hypothetical protein
MDAPASRHHTLPCAHCGRAAAELALLPAGTITAGAASTRDRLERTDFLGTLTRFGSPAELALLFDAICRGDYEAARGIDQDFVAFHCRACNTDYCEACWRLSPPVFDEGFYDYTLATCPLGHEQVVDD